MNDNEQIVLAPTSSAQLEAPRSVPGQEQTSAPASLSVMTPAQARVDAVANVLHHAYERASTLILTPDEIAGLSELFPDSAFRVGAGGNERLIYIEHASLRDRLNTVIGMGQWALIRTRPHWSEEFEYYSNQRKRTEKGTRIYADCALLVRGCLVAEAIGSMDYYPNQATNYGDAAEGAVTAAFRRCAKQFGIGLQAWNKDFCDGWMRKYGQTRPPSSATQPAKVAPSASGTPKAASPEPAREATAKTRDWMLSRLTPEFGDKALLEYAQKHEILLATETLADWPLRHVPTNAVAMKDLQQKIAVFLSGGEPPTLQPIDEDLGEAQFPDEEPAKPGPLGQQVSGKLEQVTLKEGEKKNGEAWSLWGLKVDGKWYNTFSNTIGQLALSFKGKDILLTYEEGEKGNVALAVKPKLAPNDQL